ncbi:MAG: hypothetical protein ACXWEI_16625, partial [Mycobacterium sp.]
MTHFLKGLLARTPQEIAVAIVRAAMVIIALLLVLLLKLVDLLRWLLRTKALVPEESEARCG